MKKFNFQWVTLEDVKHGMIHVRLMWYNLSKEKSDLDVVSFHYSRLLN